MSDNQKTIIAFIKDSAKKYKLKVDCSWSFSNVGTIYFRKGLKTVGTMSLDFQSGYVSASFLKGSQVAQYFGKNDKLWCIQYENLEQIEQFDHYIGRLT